MRKQIEVQFQKLVGMLGVKPMTVTDGALVVQGTGPGRLIAMHSGGKVHLELSLDGPACAALAAQLTSDKGA